MPIERATERRGSAKRSVQLPDGEVSYTDTSPEAIARIIRSRSKLAKAEAKLEAASKHGRR